jgi:succinate-acetate transporter protein
MKNSAVCPYFDLSEDVCDVGCGYISSHDAGMIIRHCSCQYEECQTYRGLEDRFAGTAAVHPLRESAQTAPPLAAAKASPVLGLFSYSIVAASYAVDKLPGLQLNLHLLAVVLMLGASGQICAGLNALRSNSLRAIAFTGAGLFWLSVLAVDILPRAGYGAPAGAVAMTGYYGMWGLFCLIICQALEQLSRACRITFALMTVFLLCLATAFATGNSLVLTGAALVGLASSLPGGYLALRNLASESRSLFHFAAAGFGSSRMRS